METLDHPKTNWYMSPSKGAKNEPKERKLAILELTDVVLKQQVIVKHYGIQQYTVSCIIRGMNEIRSNESTEERKHKP